MMDKVLLFVDFGIMVLAFIALSRGLHYTILLRLRQRR